MICPADTIVPVAQETATSACMSPAFPAELERKVHHLCRLLADANRLRILVMLSRETELHVSAFCQRLRQSQPAVSHHLALMKEAGLLEMRREGKHNFYSAPQSVLLLVQQLFGVIDEAPLKTSDDAA